MALEEKTVPYELLVRFNPDGTVRGAHVVDLDMVMKDGAVIAERTGQARAVSPEDIGNLIGQQNAAMLKQIGDLTEAKSRAENRLSALTEAAEKAT